MADYRAQIVAQQATGDPGRDYVTNVLHYAAPTTGPSAIGDALLSAFTTGPGGSYGSSANVWVKIYDLAAPLHSPPVYTAHLAGSGRSGLAPRQLAACLSFYSGLNIKGQRGRIFLGGFSAASINEYITTTQMSNIMSLAALLQHPGGSDVVHTIRHPKTSSFSNVSNYWCNNRWDTMRSRLPRETARQTLP